MTSRAFYTIGHSTRPIDEFIALLGANGVDFLVDVRRMPRSHTNPQFNEDALPASLRAAGIGYRHVARLGGLRKRSRPESESPNTWWENASFRNYADYATTPEFRAGLAELLSLGREHTCAVMCAEAVWWRCHRRFIADYLLAAGQPVFHILAQDRTDPAVLTPAAQRRPDGALIYRKA